MDAQNQNSLIKNFYIKFIIFAFFINISYLVFSLLEIDHTIKKIDLADVTTTIADKETILQNKLGHYSSFLQYVKGSKEFQNYLLDPQKNKMIMVDEILKHLPEYEHISQFRYIDKDEKEKIRMEKNTTTGVYYPILERNLQDKSKRDYFDNSKSKPFNTIYLSSFDSNIEDGKIIIPLEDNGRYNGILLINLQMAEILQENFNFPMYDYRLVNEDGDILASSFEREVWSSDKKVKLSLKDIFPKEYKSIIEDPYYEGEKFRSLHLNRIATEKKLIVILSVKEDHLSQMYKELLLDSVVYIFFIFIFSLFLAYLLAGGLKDLLQQFLKQEKHIFEIEKYKDVLKEQVQEQTKQIQTQYDTLRKTNENLRLFEKIIENSYTGVSLADATQDDIPIIYVNKTFEKITKYSKNEVLNKNCRFLQGDKPDEIKRAKIRKAIQEQKSIQIELQNYTKDGKMFWNLLNLSPLFNEFGELTHYIGIQHDITHRKNYEINIKLLNKKLEKAKEKAINESKAKTIFLATMSHEIRTPLNAILGFLNLAKDPKISNESKTEYIDIIDTNATALLDIINTILDIAKIESGELILDKKPFEIFTSYKQVITLFDAKAKEKNINFIYCIDEELKNKIVIGDDIKLKQVLSNLISNAIKFTPGNGNIDVTLKLISQDDKDITLEYCVKDSGIGISENKIQSIFEPFVQEDHSTSRDYGGTGLGLNICKEIIEKMGGEISVQSTKEKGSTFGFTLSFELSDEIQAQEEKIDFNELYFKGTILVADDAPINLKLVKTLLEKHGLDVLLAKDGIEALECFKSSYNKIDMVLMDINMPNLDGTQAMKEIKTLQKSLDDDTPIIAFSANAIVGDKEKYLNLGFDGCLEKPIQQDRLFTLVDRYTQIQEIDTSISLDALAQNLGVDLALYMEFLQEYLETLDEELDLLEKAIKGDDIQKIKQIAHKLKGISGNMGFDELFTLFESFEDPNNDLSDLLDKIKNGVKKLDSLTNR